MEINFINILTITYSIAGMVTFTGFIPTIRDLYHQKPSANISTYTIWTITTLITSLYGFFVLKDLVFNIVYNLGLIACITILIMRLRLKFKYKL